jgi:hypothetical protein
LGKGWKPVVFGRGDAVEGEGVLEELFGEGER